jgi:hypothetical protein
MVDGECAALMSNLHSKASVGDLMVVHKKYSHVKLLGVAKLLCIQFFQGPDLRSFYFFIYVSYLHGKLLLQIIECLA